MSIDQNTFGTMDRSQRIVPASGKIYDITHADTDEHSVALPAGFPANTKSITIWVNRIAGAGSLMTRSVSGQAFSTWILATNQTGIWYRAIDGLFYYRLSIANDDFDVYAVAYITG